MKAALARKATPNLAKWLHNAASAGFVSIRQVLSI
jgi:hypothetical protein